MNQLGTGEASEATHGNSDLQKELAEVLRQRAAISEVLRAVASSPHDLQPILQTISTGADRMGWTPAGLASGLRFPAPGNRRRKPGRLREDRGDDPGARR